MVFAKFPFLLVIFLLVVGAGRVIPFLFIGFGLWMLLGFVGHTVRYESRPRVTAEELGTIRTDVAVGLLDVDDDVRLPSNTDARSRFAAAGAYYVKASAALDRGVRRRDREAVARTLYRARYELEAASAALDGRTVPEPADSAKITRPVAVATRPSYQRHRSCYRW
jgi:hypothetical protein